MPSVDKPASVAERVYAILAEQIGLDRESLHRDLPLADLGADSLDMVGAFLEVEIAFEITVTDEQWARLRTLGDLVDLVEQQRQTGSIRQAPTLLPPLSAGAGRRRLLYLGIRLLTSTVYRVRVLGGENVPATGGALLVPNHVSFVDALFLLASIRRPVRFIVEASYYYKPLARPFLEALGAIPIAASGGPRVIMRALRDAGDYLDRGELVCIFPEGQLTRTGLMTPFQRGMERILKGRQVPVIPIYLDRIWGSVFSRAGGRFLWKWPSRIPYPATVCIGAPLPPTTPVPSVRLTVHNLSEQAWAERKRDILPLHRSFVRKARRGPFQLALADGLRGPVNRLQALTGAIALARALRARWQGRSHVGILLPPSVAGALVNLAAALAGKVAVNLNFTAGKKGLTSAATQAGLTSVVTSREVLARTGVELPEGIEPIWLEEIRETIGRGSRGWATLLALFAPTRWLERACGMENQPRIDDVVTIIFSSGSTGDPKGVMLSHLNIAANVEAVAQVFGVEPDDRLLGILPLFHSFGYLSLWVGVNQGIGLVFHPSPLDAAAIGDLVERYRATLLLATPTFLQLYQRRCSPAQFGSLRIVLAGAEKLQERAAQAFEDHFGIRPLEGYGMTECSPVVAASTLDFRAAGFYQPGSRRGSVGQPLPGVAVSLVDPDTFAPLPPGTPGLLLVKGLNVMRGYLGRDDLTTKALRDGWYVTGDIAHLDDDGFLRITDRMSRFSKIGGEMVPHGRVEEALQQAAGTTEPAFVVLGLPDERKGEKLAVIHTLPDERVPGILEQLAGSGLPNLFIPRRENFVRVEQLPMLGTGKLDQREAKRLAQTALG